MREVLLGALKSADRVGLYSSVALAFPALLENPSENRPLLNLVNIGSVHRESWR